MIIRSLEEMPIGGLEDGEVIVILSAKTSFPNSSGGKISLTKGKHHALVRDPNSLELENVPPMSWEAFWELAPGATIKDKRVKSRMPNFLA